MSAIPIQPPRTSLSQRQLNARRMTLASTSASKQQQVATHHREPSASPLLIRTLTRYGSRMHVEGIRPGLVAAKTPPTSKRTLRSLSSGMSPHLMLPGPLRPQATSPASHDLLRGPFPSSQSRMSSSVSDRHQPTSGPEPASPPPRFITTRRLLTPHLGSLWKRIGIEAAWVASCRSQARASGSKAVTQITGPSSGTRSAAAKLGYSRPAPPPTPDLRPGSTPYRKAQRLIHHLRHRSMVGPDEMEGLRAGLKGIRVSADSAGYVVQGPDP